MKPGIKTTEFWGTITLVISNLIGMLVVVGFIDQSDQQSLTQHVTALVAAIEAFAVNGLAIWRYIQSREKLKNSPIRRPRCDPMPSLRTRRVRTRRGRSESNAAQRVRCYVFKE